MHLESIKLIDTDGTLAFRLELEQWNKSFPMSATLVLTFDKISPIRIVTTMDKAAILATFAFCPIVLKNPLTEDGKSETLKPQEAKRLIEAEVNRWKKVAESPSD